MACCFVAFSAQAEIKSKEVVYKVGDVEFTGYLSYDDAITGKRPGVLVVHEWWGHNSYARTRAEMLAELGYTALALDMYGTGKLAEHPNDAQAMASVVRDFAVAKARFDKAHEVLRSEPTVDPSRTALQIPSSSPSTLRPSKPSLKRRERTIRSSNTKA